LERKADLPGKQNFLFWPALIDVGDEEIGQRDAVGLLRPCTT
jgi:hypothetical protein